MMGSNQLPTKYLRKLFHVWEFEFQFSEHIIIDEMEKIISTKQLAATELPSSIAWGLRKAPSMKQSNSRSPSYNNVFTEESAAMRSLFSSKIATKN